MMKKETKKKEIKTARQVQQELKLKAKQDKELQKIKIIKNKAEADKLPKNKTFSRSLKARFLDKFFPSKTFLVEMNHANGTKSHMIIKGQTHKFSYKDCSYVIDEAVKTYCNTSKIYMLQYHEGFVMPFSTRIESQELKKGIPTDCADIVTSYNPVVLKEVLKFEYAKGVIQGAEVHDFIRKSFIMLIITLVAVITHFAVNAFKSGWVG